MDIEGTYTLQAPAEDVWHCLMDGRTIQHAVPGLQRLSRIDEHHYTFTIHMRQAPLRGSYTGSAGILEPVYPSSYRLSIEGEGPNGTFQSECALELKAQNQNTVVIYQGHVQFERGNVLIPAPLVKATIRMLLQHFFTTLTDQLRAGRTGARDESAPEEMAAGLLTAQPVGAPPSVRLHSASGPLYQLVRLLRLGRQNPDQEELWARRLRQAGVFTVLLLLVWIGTRIPRRLQAIR